MITPETNDREKSLQLLTHGSRDLSVEVRRPHHVLLSTCKTPLVCAPDVPTFPTKKRDLPKLVVDFPRERDTFRTKSMDIVDDFVEQSYNNNGKPWKSLSICRMKQKLLFSFFLHFLNFSFTFFFIFFILFMFYHFLHFLHFSSFSLVFSLVFIVFIFFIFYLCSSCFFFLKHFLHASSGSSFLIFLCFFFFAETRQHFTTKRHVQVRPRAQPHHRRSHVRKSWRSGTSTTLPGWRYHTGGSRSIPTVHPC